MNIELVIQEGEGQYIEFKEKADKKLAKEMVAFANASGGNIYIGISDNGRIVGTDSSNKVLSQLQDIANNCDPQINLKISKETNILALRVFEGSDKPYQCSDGFYLRVGPNSQKLSRDQILKFGIDAGKIRFDEQICPNATLKDLDEDKLHYYFQLANINTSSLNIEDLLSNLGVYTLPKMVCKQIIF